MEYIKILTKYNKLWNPVRFSAQRFYASVASPPSSKDVLPISEMPGPRSLPFFGCALTLFRHKDFDRRRIHKVFISLIKEHGRTVRLDLPGIPPAVIITLPEDIENLYRVTMNNPIRKGNYSMKKVRYENEDNYFEKKGGILIENDEEWWRVRSRVQAPMMKPKNIFKYLPQMDKATLEFMDIIEDYQNKYNEMPPTFVEDIYKWALEAVGLVTLNRRLGCLQPNLPEDSMQMKLINSVSSIFKNLSITEIGLQLWRIFPTPAYKKLRESHNLFLRIADENIRETEEELKMKKSSNEEVELTLMETLLNTEGLTRKDVVTLILDMLMAGIDTTSHTVSFVLYLLARNPEVQKKLQNEVDTVLGDGKQTISENHLAQLSYLKACVKESFRLLPIVLGTVRELEADAVFGGYLVPKGFQVIFPSYFITKDETYFKKANEFIPERWGRDSPLGPIHPFAHLPFSHGTRMCVGRRIAEQEIYTLIARVMHRYSVHYKYKDIEIWTKFINAPSEPLRFEFLKRR